MSVGNALRPWKKHEVLGSRRFRDNLVSVNPDFCVANVLTDLITSILHSEEAFVDATIVPKARIEDGR